MLLGLFVSGLILMACETKVQEESVPAKPVEKVEVEPEAETVVVNADSVVMIVDAWRTKVESLEVTPLNLSTKDLRAKIKQKWSNIHFYAQDGKVVKIKTYPHAGISERTEEFYIKDGELALVVIEDQGAGEKGKSKNEIDKLYYFSNGNLVKESKSNNEGEFSVRKSDAEELMAEYSEYLEVYENTLK